MLIDAPGYDSESGNTEKSGKKPKEIDLTEDNLMEVFNGFDLTNYK